MSTPENGRALPGRNAVGGGAAPGRRPINLDRLAMEPAGSLGRDLVERFEGRASLAARVCACLVATLPEHFDGAAAVLWISASMGERGFTPAEIRASLPRSGFKPRRKGSKQSPGDRPEPKNTLKQPNLSKQSDQRSEL